MTLHAITEDVQSDEQTLEDQTEQADHHDQTNDENDADGTTEKLQHAGSPYSWGHTGVTQAQPPMFPLFLRHGAQ